MSARASRRRVRALLRNLTAATTAQIQITVDRDRAVLTGGAK